MTLPSPASLPLPTPRRRLPLPAWLRAHPGLALVPAVFVTSALLGEAVHHGPVLCAFRLSTGLPCAGCGMTRAFVEISHGDVGAALDYNLLSPLAYLWLAVWWLLAILAVVRGRAVPEVPRWLAHTALGVLVGYWVARVGWALAQPGAWAAMAADSPVVGLVDRVLGAWLGR